MVTKSTERQGEKKNKYDCTITEEMHIHLFDIQQRIGPGEFRNLGFMMTTLAVTLASGKN